MFWWRRTYVVALVSRLGNVGVPLGRAVIRKQVSEDRWNNFATRWSLDARLLG